MNFYLLIVRENNNESLQINKLHDKLAFSLSHETAWIKIVRDSITVLWNYVKNEL